MGTKAFIHKIYAYRFFGHFMFIFPLIVLMFEANGLTDIQIASLLSIWYAVSFMLEVPSGIIADRISRKYVLLFAELCLSAAFVAWMVAPTFYGYLLGYVFWGMHSAFMSGTVQAFFYDGMKALGAEKDFKKHYGRSRSFAYMGIFLSSVASGLLLAIGQYELVLLGSIVSNLVAIGILVTMPEVRITESTGEVQSLSLLVGSIRHISKSRVLLSLLVLLTFLISVDGPIDEYTSFYVSEAGVPVELIGSFIGITTLCGAVASFYADKVGKRSNVFYYGLVIISGLNYVIGSVLLNVITLLIILFDVFVFEILTVALEEMVQEQATSEQRATISSIISFSTRLFAIPLFLAIGATAEQAGYRTGFFVLGGVLTVIGIVYWLVGAWQQNRSFPA